MDGSSDACNGISDRDSRRGEAIDSGVVGKRAERMPEPKHLCHAFLTVVVWHQYKIRDKVLIHIDQYTRQGSAHRLNVIRTTQPGALRTSSQSKLARTNAA